MALNNQNSTSAAFYISHTDYSFHLSNNCYTLSTELIAKYLELITQLFAMLFFLTSLCMLPFKLSVEFPIILSLLPLFF